MHQHAADRLAALYEAPFGGKQRGRFRVSMKLMRSICGRRRLYDDDITAIRRALCERGFLLIDMETFFAILSEPTLQSYRRVNAENLGLSGPVSDAGSDGQRGVGIPVRRKAKAGRPRAVTNRNDGGPEDMTS